MATKGKDKMSRAEMLVRAADARAKVQAAIEGSGGIMTPDQIMPYLNGMGYTPASLYSLLHSMAENKLITKVEVMHPDFKYGYASSVFSTSAPDKAVGKGVSTKVVKLPKKDKAETPIAISVNERTGSLTVRYFGLKITFSKED